MKTLLDTNPILATKTVALHNFADAVEQKPVNKKDYVLYFGRYSLEKGIATLVQVARELPQIPFVFAGSGPLEHLLEGVPNIKNVGFQSGEALETLIREARFTVLPSEWYENCPFSVLESISLGTPVLGASIGGIPELIQPGQTGEVFDAHNADAMKEKIVQLFAADSARYTKQCMASCFETVETYCEELVRYYA
jgi:glycosyltransferase involved in cell wall biosynthesis